MVPGCTLGSPGGHAAPPGGLCTPSHAPQSIEGLRTPHKVPVASGKLGLCVGAKERRGCGASLLGQQ